MKKLNKLAVVVALIGVTSISTGCYSAKMRMRPTTEPMLYPGLSYSADPVSGPAWGDTYLRVVDFPLSFALDTALLPFDIGAMLLLSE